MPHCIGPGGEVPAGGDEGGAVGRDVVEGLGRGRVPQELAVAHPPVHREQGCHSRARLGGLGFESDDLAIGNVGPKGEHRPIAGVGDDQQIPRLVEGQLHGLLRDVPNRLGPAGFLRPAVDAVLAGVREIDVALAVHRRAGDVQEPIGELLDLGPGGQDRRIRWRPGGARPAGDIQHGELRIANLDAGGRIEDRAVERDPAVAVAVEVPEADVAGIADLGRVRERHEATDHAVEEGVGELEVARAVDFQGQGLGAFFPLLLELHRVESPVGGVSNDHLVADMVFEGHRIHPAARRGVRNVHAGLGVGTGRPDVLEGSAAAVGDPEAGGLAVPGVAIAQPAETAPFARNPRAVPAVQADIIHHGIRPGHPFDADGAGIDRARVDADAGDDIGPALRGLDDRLRLAGTLKRGGLFRHVDHRGRRIEADQHGVRPERQRVADAIPSHRQIERPVFRNRLFERRRVVGLAVAGDAQRSDVDPGGGLGKSGDVRCHGRRQGGYLVGRQGGFDLSIGAQSRRGAARGRTARPGTPARPPRRSCRSRGNWPGPARPCRRRFAG